MSVRINIGCGLTPTEGWHNYDNSWSIRLSRVPALGRLLRAVGWISGRQLEFIEFASRSSIKRANASKRIPEASNSVECVYASHMLEHLSKTEAEGFLREARRVLRPGGVIRLSVPDIRLQAEEYLEHNDAERFLRRTELGRERPTTLVGRLVYLVVGDRKHQWMYDGASLCELLNQAGFRDAKVMSSGTTVIEDSEPLDLKERSYESVVVEAVNP